MSDFVEWDGHAFRVAAIATVAFRASDAFPVTVYTRDNQCFLVRGDLRTIIQHLETGTPRTFFRTRSVHGTEYFVAFAAVRAVTLPSQLHSRIYAAAEITVPYHEGLVTFLEKRGKIHTRTWYMVREELDNRWSPGLLKLVGDREHEIHKALEQEAETLKELDCAPIPSWPPQPRPVSTWEAFGLPVPVYQEHRFEYAPGYAPVRLEGE